MTAELIIAPEVKQDVYGTQPDAFPLSLRYRGKVPVTSIVSPEYLKGFRMNTAAIKKAEIIKQLSRASEKDLDRIRMCIESVLTESTSTAQRSNSLKGIWKGKGFERLADLEKEIRQARRELGDSILKREP